MVDTGGELRGYPEPAVVLVQIPGAADVFKILGEPSIVVATGTADPFS
jgi:hypothetical protein